MAANAADQDALQQELAEQVESIYSSAEQSERTALEMTKDVKQLDTAKKNLTETITMLKRLQMLGKIRHNSTDG